MCLVVFYIFDVCLFEITKPNKGERRCLPLQPSDISFSFEFLLAKKNVSIVQEWISSLLHPYFAFNHFIENPPIVFSISLKIGR